MLRRLRIAASVFFAVVTVALCVLWVRSYYYSDSLAIGFRVGRIPHFTSHTGGLSLLTPWTNTKYLSWYSRRIEPDAKPVPTGAFGFRLRPKPTSALVLTVPHWLMILVCALITVVPWMGIRGRFSLRALLIATTLVAVVLGAVVWATK